MPAPEPQQPTINLATFRANGEEVRTPVWFTVKDDKFWVLTFRDSWKSKRLRKNARVRFAPCDSSGKRILGDWSEGSAQMDEDPERLKWLTAALKQKYTWRYLLIVQIFYPLFGKRGESVAIEVAPIA